MTRSFALLVLLLCGCSGDARDPLAPPTDTPLVCAGCGPTDLALISAEILWPRQDRILYSGDSVRVEVRVRNRGTVPSDTTLYISGRGSRSDAGGQLRLRSIPAGGTLTDTLIMRVPLVHDDTASIDHFGVDLNDWHGADTTSDNNTIGFEPIVFRPTYMRVTGPDTIRAEQIYDFKLTITHPAPHPLRPASIGVCFEAPQCRGPVLLRIAGPNVPAGSTVEIPLRVRVPVTESLNFPQSGYISGCYGYPGISTECGWRRVVLLPPL